ncbi:hypothetical protein [Burkholderia sp. Ac-20365]|uniref:hypothetical protein n=1 Tax=Burkholderia sp. Ac-20365 TaxID=2703897 RepID=UPI00197BE0E4|nr:hypothetical protein [Burkholderia sp. Ac-20365]MBN3761269.1 hypothetical protein [Burkholderia sp. Ac-20365]
MNPMKSVFSLAILAATLASVGANAAVIEGTACPVENSGSGGEEANSYLICANEKWQDARKLAGTVVSTTVTSPNGKYVEFVRTTSQLEGVRSVWQSSNDEGAVTVVATVKSVQPDNKAHLVMDIADSRQSWEKHVDTVMSLDDKSVVATDKEGREYRVMVVARRPS